MRPTKASSEAKRPERSASRAFTRIVLRNASVSHRTVFAPRSGLFLRAGESTREAAFEPSLRGERTFFDFVEYSTEPAKRENSFYSEPSSAEPSSRTFYFGLQLYRCARPDFVDWDPLRFLEISWKILDFGLQLF